MAFDVSYIIQATDEFSTNLKKFQKEMGAVAKKAKTVSDRISSMSKGMQKWGRGISMKVGAPMAAFGVLAIKTSNDFAKSMNMVQAVTDATGQQIKSLRNVSIKYGMETQFTARQAADAMSKLALSGMDVKEITGALPSVLRLAAAGQLDMATSATISTNALHMYGLKISDLPHLTDLMTRSFTKANTNLTDLGEALKNLGPQARLAGVPLQEVFASLMKIAQAGLPGSRGGMAFRQAIKSMIAPTPKALKLMKLLNLQFVDTSGHMLHMQDILSRIDLLMKKGVMKPAALTEIFGTRGQQAIGNLVKITTDSFDGFYDILSEVDGVSKHIAETQMQGLPGAIYKLKAALEHLQIKTEEANDTLAIGLIDALRNALLYVGNLDPAIQHITGLIGTFAIALGPLLLGLGKVLAVLVVFGKISFVTALLAGSIVVGVIALGAAFAYLYMHSKLFRDVVKDIGKFLYSAFILPFERAYNIAKKLFALVGKHTGGAALGVIPTGAAPSRFPVGAVNPMEFTPGVARAPSLTQMVKSALNIRVQDDNKIIKSITGESDADDFSMNLGTNMAFAR